MDENTTLVQLEELAAGLGIKIRYEQIKSEGAFFAGGFCVLKGERLLIIHSKASTRDKIEAIARSVARFDLAKVYLRPGLREYLAPFMKDQRPNPD